MPHRKHKNATHRLLRVNRRLLADALVQDVVHVDKDADEHEHWQEVVCAAVAVLGAKDERARDEEEDCGNDARDHRREHPGDDDGRDALEWEVLAVVDLVPDNDVTAAGNETPAHDATAACNTCRLH